MLKIDICTEEITISMRDGTEVAHWVIDEWVEDPTIVPCIANAIHLAHSDQKKLIALNKEHIDSQRKINKRYL